MNIKFNLKTDLNKERTLEKTKSVLFRCMLKMQELATINCPVDTGRLSWGIKIFPTSIGFSKYLLYDNVEYAEAIEFGTDPHVIKIKNKKVLANKKKGIIFGKQVMHPGTEAQPYFRPALDQVKNIWIERFWQRELSK